ncbi:MAG: pyridoxal phosphate-dependent aminotransferase [Gammaproteobacteria bacterium]|nr:pyridoxal phosphate-dependent aminotransferase [Gammaproteobacteria bacterium]
MSSTLDISQVAASLIPSDIRSVAEMGMQMDDVVALWFGESAWPSPEIAVEAAQAALGSNDHFYQPNSGKPQLREAIAHYYQKIYQLDVSVPQISVTGSGMQGVMLTAQAIVNPGDSVVVLQPSWPNLGEAFRLMGAAVVPFSLIEKERQWYLPLDELLAQLTHHTRAVVVNSPNNPTGWTMDANEQQILLDHCRDRGIWIISDDVYSRLYPHSDFAPTFLSLTEPEDKLISINSFSKAFSMTGWRLGWIVAPASLEPTYAMLNEFNIAGPAAFIQTAGARVLQHGESAVSVLKHRLAHALELTQSFLAETPGVTMIQPTGAFYAMLRIHEMENSVDTAKDLLLQNRVGMAPGAAFGQSADAYLRMCYAQPDHVLIEALNRFKSYLQNKS